MLLGWAAFFKGADFLFFSTSRFLINMSGSSLIFDSKSPSEQAEAFFQLGPKLTKPEDNTLSSLARSFNSIFFFPSKKLSCIELAVEADPEYIQSSFLILNSNYLIQNLDNLRHTLCRWKILSG